MSSLRLIKGSPVKSSFPSTFGGANLVWYDRPLAGWIHRPSTLSTSTSSGTSKFSTASIDTPFAESISSNFTACGTVLGNPSKMKPFRHSGALTASSIILHSQVKHLCQSPRRTQEHSVGPRVSSLALERAIATLHTHPTTISSLTSAPLSMACLAFTPFGVFAATAARNMSPVARWHRQWSDLILGDCVPCSASRRVVSRVSRSALFEVLTVEVDGRKRAPCRIPADR